MEKRIERVHFGLDVHIGHDLTICYHRKRTHYYTDNIDMHTHFGIFSVHCVTHQIKHQGHKSSNKYKKKIVGFWFVRCLSPRVKEKERERGKREFRNSARWFRICEDVADSPIHVCAANRTSALVTYFHFLPFFLYKFCFRLNSAFLFVRFGSIHSPHILWMRNRKDNILLFDTYSTVLLLLLLHWLKRFVRHRSDQT